MGVAVGIVAAMAMVLSRKKAAKEEEATTPSSLTASRRTPS